MDLPIENSGIQSRISNSLHKISSVFDMLTFFIFQFLLLEKKGTEASYYLLFTFGFESNFSIKMH